MKKKTNPNGITILFIISFCLNIFLILLLIVDVGLDFPLSSTQTGNLQFNQVNQAVLPGENAIVSVAGVAVIVRGESLGAPGNIVITLRDLTNNPVAELPGWRFERMANIEFFENGSSVPEKIFNPKLVVCYELSEAQQLQKSEYHILKFNSQDQTWAELASLAQPVEGQLCAETEQLSLFALAQKLPEQAPGTNKLPEPTPTIEGPYEP